MNIYNFEMSIVAMVVVIALTYVPYVLLLAIPYKKILEKTNQSNTWLAFIPLVAEYKMGKFSYESLFNGNPKNELMRKITGFTMIIVPFVSSLLFSLNMDGFIDSELAGRRNFGNISKMIYFIGNNEYILAITLLLSTVPVIVGIIGMVSSTTFSDFSLSGAIIVSLVLFFLPSTLVSIVGLVIINMVAYKNDIYGKYDYEQNYSEVVKIK